MTDHHAISLWPSCWRQLGRLICKLCFWHFLWHQSRGPCFHLTAACHVCRSLTYLHADHSLEVKVYKLRHMQGQWQVKPAHLLAMEL